MIWWPDTCYCKIQTDAPSKNGTFLKRCRLHNTTRDTTTVYAHNLSNRKGTNENQDASITRKENLRKTTR